MTAPTIVAIPKIALDQRASMVWTPPSRQSGGVHIHPDMTAFARLPVLTGAAPVVALSVPIEASTGGTRNVCFTSTPAVRRVGAGAQVSKSTSGDTGVSDCALGSTARDISGSNPSRSATS